MQEWATNGLLPDRTILLDCDVNLARGRMKGRDEHPDRMEQEDPAFHRRVREGYLELARSQPDRILVLDAAKPLSEVITDFHSFFWKPFLERS
jgi:dTMP kinase